MKNKYLYCQVCNDFQEHYFIGEQDIEGITEFEGSRFYYYNCAVCNNTKVQIEKPNKLERKLI